MQNFLRSPGESLSKKVAEYDERLLVGLALFMICTFSLAQMPVIPDHIFIPIGVVLAVGFAVWVFRTILKRNQFALGLSGERAVGEEINLLMRDGCYVFHDFPGGKNWNIDHVIVSSQGVFSVETKACRKRFAHGKRDYDIVFDGTTLRFPTWTNTKYVEQARRNASGLSKFLSSALATPVPVTPVLTFPGWFVVNKTASEVKVLNPRMIRTLVLGNGAPLSEKTIKQIAHQLDQKCRDCEI